MAQISGSVENIIFRNEENGYSVVEIDSGGQPVTCVGNFPVLLEGQNLEITGEFKTGKYGVQFNCTLIKYSAPTSPESIARYLASGLIKGVGPATASAIVDKFGTNTLEIIEQQPALLATIKGITIKKAGEIASSLIKLKEIQSAVMFLQQYNVTVNTALKIYKVYGEDTENKLKANPYRLVEDIEGIGFLTADKIAVNMGVERLSEFRLRAGLIHGLKQSAESMGSTFIPKDDLISYSIKLLSIDETESLNLIDNIIDNLKIEDQIKTFSFDGRECLMLTVYHNIENAIAVKLIKLKNFCLPLTDDLSENIERYQKQYNIVLHSVQVEAVKKACESGVAVITGGPGTGKTTIIKCILSIFREQRLKVLLAAPTGRAAKRLSESTGAEAKTIHRLLDIDFKNGGGYFTYNENTRLDADVVIIDEVSMVDSFLFNSLVKSLNDGSKLILVGDKDQLPSVGAGNVLSEIISSKCIDVVSLKEIYRQGDGSLIVVNAHAINRGEMPNLDVKNSDFFFTEKRNPEDILNTVISLCTERLPSFAKVSPCDIQVLTPMKKGVSGVANINKSLQAIINPPARHKSEFKYEDRIFRVGDKVMQTVNNYRLEWVKESKHFGTGEGVFNGDIGYIKDINGALELTVEFEDGRIASYSISEVGELTLAYAISVHKSQGCEFDVVVLPLSGGPPTLLTRNLLYTAITRAKKMVVIVGAKYNVNGMVKNNYTQNRYSMLAEFLRQQSLRFGELL